MNIIHLLICAYIVTDAGSALNDTKPPHYSRFLVQVRCILILSGDVALINQDLRNMVRMIPG